MSYHGLGFDASEMLNRQAERSKTTATTATEMSYSTSATSAKSADIGFRGERGRLQAMKIMMPAYVRALSDAVQSRALSLAEKSQLADRRGAARSLQGALDAVRPHEAGWIRKDIDQLRAIAASGRLPTAADLRLLTKAGASGARDLAGRISQAWTDLHKSLLARGRWPRSAVTTESKTVSAPSTSWGTWRGAGYSAPSKPTAPSAPSAAEEDARRKEALRAEERRRMQSESNARIAEARAEAERAEAEAEALREAVAQAREVASEQAEELASRLAQVEAAAAQARSRAEAELQAQRKKGQLWMWGLGALAIGLGGYGLWRASR